MHPEITDTQLDVLVQPTLACLFFIFPRRAAWD